MKKEEFSLREQIAKLEEIEAYFQRPDMNLEEAFQKHKEALHIAKQILAYLDKAESTVEQLENGI